MRALAQGAWTDEKSDGHLHVTRLAGGPGRRRRLRRRRHPPGGMTGDEAGESTDDLRNVVDRAVESGDLETLSTA
ncbi:MAG: hypothetical protein FJ000_09320, partial [Actinobacteria bacterium]|nr:hypothetical protein [Actinomycetota bacterium]